MNVAYLIPALPLAGFVALLVLGRKLGDPLAGWLATAAIGSSFLVTLITFVTFARMLNDIGGPVLVFFVLVVAAAEVVVGLGIIGSICRRRAGATADALHLLKG